MEMFAACLCIFVGLAFGDLQRVEIAKDDMKATENGREAVSLDAKATIKQDQYLRSKVVHTTAQCVSRSSNETETSEIISSAVTPMTLTYGPSQEKKIEPTVHVETRVADPRSLKKHSNQHLSGQNASMGAKARFSRSTKKRRLFRRNLSLDYITPDFGIMNRKIEELKKRLEPSFYDETFDTDNLEMKLIEDFQNSGSASPDNLAAYTAALNAERKLVKEKVAADGSKADDLIDAYRTIRTPAGLRYRSVRQRYRGFWETPSLALAKYQIFKRDEYASFDSFLEEIRPHQAQKSYIAMKYILNKLPSVLQDLIFYTDDQERFILKKSGKSDFMWDFVINDYYLAKLDERELLQRLLVEMPTLLPTYKALRKGVAWNYTRLDDKFVAFFQKPSERLTQYEALMKDDLDSLDKFLVENIQADPYGYLDEIEAEKVLKRKTRKLKKYKH